MDIQKPRRFATTDRAHADLFNEAIDQLNVNDERIAKRAEEAEEKAKAYAQTNINQLKEFAQLVKITKDNGVEKLHITDGDALEQLFNLGPGYHTFAVSTHVANRPPGSLGYIRGTFLNAGTDGYGFIIATDTAGNIFTNTINGGVWKGWQKSETDSGSQEKTDKASADLKSYIENNYTNQHLTVLTGSQAIQDATTSGNEYPFGFTLMDIGQNNTTGYPLNFGFVKNEKWSDYRFSQYFYGNADQRNGYNYTGTWIRHWWSGSGWTNWEKISGYIHVNVSTTGKQALIKGAINKIEYNRIIKDSHNLYDTSKNRFTASHSGMYLVGAGVYIENLMNYSNFELMVYRNGIKYKNIAQYRVPTPANPSAAELNVGVYGSCTVPMDAGDYLEIYMYVGHNGNETRYVADRTGEYNYFDIMELGGINYPRR
ncbi:hypothetical protein CHCC14821_1159 [Bacillus paralicheniformis]|uniref:hypothetical protein n=1 Tax=Bacillus paralicheniformis TaxID=1648923 RepID=UPI00119CF0E8|nr:hypothetical protein CHCC14821_1159 [Bacillus paralicheniformis]